MLDLSHLLFTFGIPITLIIFLLYCYSVIYKGTEQMRKQQFLIRSGTLLLVFAMVAYDIYPPFQIYSPAYVQDWIKILLYALFWTLIVLAVIRTHSKLPDDMKQKHMNAYLYPLVAILINQYWTREPKIINDILVKGPINYVAALTLTGVLIIFFNWLTLRKIRRNNVR